MARDRNEKIWMIGGGVAAVALAGGLWMFAVSPQLDDVDSLHSQTNDAQVQNTTLQANVSKLKSAYDHMDDVKRELRAAQTQLPADSGLAALTTQISNQARAAHVQITQFNVSSPEAVDASSAPSSAPSGDTSTSATPTTTTSSTAPSGIYAIGISLGASGSRANELAFARAIQHDGPRSAFVSNVNLGAGSNTASVGGAPNTGAASGSSLTMQLTVFVAPTTTDVAPTVAAAPSATPTAVAAPAGS